ncbi:MAG: YtxH domain-containing protein [Balneolaceae bacterium]
MSKTLGIIATSLVSFSAGVLVGMLITPQSGRDNRRWISEHSSEAKHWVEDKGHQIIEESEKKLEKISDNIKGAIPDLYEATEDVQLDESDMRDVS